MRKYTLLTLLLFCVSMVYAQVEISPEAGRRTRARMWLYAPPEGTPANNHAVIICPGGSYHHLGIFHEGHDVARYLSEKGFCAFVLRYSTSLHRYHYPTMMKDIVWAMEQAIERAPVWPYDAGNIGVMGFSAGGHLVGWMGTYFPTPEVKPAFVAMLYPVVSMQDSLVHEYSRKNLLTKKPDPVLLEQMSLERHVPADMSPVFLLACDDDPVVDVVNSLVYEQALKAQDIPYRFEHYTIGGHGFGYDVHKETSIRWMKAFLEWHESLFGPYLKAGNK